MKDSLPLSHPPPNLHTHPRHIRHPVVKLPVRINSSLGAPFYCTDTRGLMRP
ncbi:MAG: hypothetical protein K8R19_05070 [Methanosarcinales archaeon]|nr:hypothetical protein [Methanosarcinales archaeon]